MVTLLGDKDSYSAIMHSYGLKMVFFFGK